MKDYHVRLLLDAMTAAYSQEELEDSTKLLDALIDVLNLEPSAALALVNGASTLKRLRDELAPQPSSQVH